MSSNYLQYLSLNNLRPLLYNLAYGSAINLFGGQQQVCPITGDNNSSFPTADSMNASGFSRLQVLEMGIIALTIIDNLYLQLQHGGISNKKVTDLTEMLKNNTIATIGSAISGYFLNGTAGVIQSFSRMFFFNLAYKNGEIKTANPGLIKQKKELQKSLNTANERAKEAQNDLKFFKKDSYGPRNDQYVKIQGELTEAINKINKLQRENTLSQQYINQLEQELYKANNWYKQMQMQIKQ